MNSYLVPYNLSRYLVLSWVLGAVAFVVWWIVINVMVLGAPVLYRVGVMWAQWAEGPFLLAVMAGTIASASVGVETYLRRLAVHWVIVLPLLAGLIAFVPTFLVCLAYELALPYTASDAFRPVLASASTVTLRYRIVEWAVAGFCSGLGPIVVRIVWVFAGRFEHRIPAIVGYPPGKKTWPSVYAHVVGGVAAALSGAAVWHVLGHLWLFDLYLAFPLGCFAWASLFGLLAWGIPPELYTGWIRVLSSHRFGLRIPISAADGAPVERMVGHYPLGLDLFVGAQHGVAELHTSFVADGDGQYAVRGLSQAPTELSRLLERIDMRYDPSSPVPLEVLLSTEDVVTMGPPGQQTQVEFLLLPKEER